MTPMLDCLVNYFGLDEDEQPTYRRYFCYHIIAGPGPAAGTGFASITTLAVYNDAARCTSCQHFHVVETGGPAAALAMALRYLDFYHERDHLRKVQSAIRGLGGDDSSVVRQRLGTGDSGNQPGDGDGLRGRVFDSGRS